MNDEVIKGYEQAFKQLGSIRMNDTINGMLTEWHETKSISVATDICERLLQAGHEEDEDARTD